MNSFVNLFGNEDRRGLLPPSLTHRTPFQLATGVCCFTLSAGGGGFEILAPFNFLHDPIALAFAFESAKSFFNGFALSDFD